MGVNSPTHLLSTHPLPLLRFPDYDPAPRQPPRGMWELYQKSGRGVLLSGKFDSPRSLSPESRKIAADGEVNARK